MIARKSFEQGLELIENAIRNQCDTIEEMIRCAERGMRERRSGTAKEVLDLEKSINAAEVQIEDECLTLLALQQPVASDLRRIAAAIKINTDLERIGDLTLGFARRSDSLAAFEDLTIPAEFSEMVIFAIGMIHDAREAFLNNDAIKARVVCASDDELDALNRKVINQLVERMESEPSQVAGYLHIFSASRILERIGDHATNIAEDVEYVVDGEICRHR